MGRGHDAQEACHPQMVYGLRALGFIGCLDLRRLEVTCRNGAPTHPEMWEGGISCCGTSLVPSKPRIGAFVYSSHPVLTQASAQLYSQRRAVPPQAWPPSAFELQWHGLRAPSEASRQPPSTAFEPSPTPSNQPLKAFNSLGLHSSSTR